MNEAKLYNQIEKYLDGTLSEKERIAFESKLKQDAALQKELTLHQAFSELKLLRSEKANQFFKMLESVHEEELAKEETEPEPDVEQNIAPVGKHVMLKRVLAVAASLLLPVLAYFVFFKADKYEQLFDEYAVYEKLESERSSNPDQVFKELKTAFHKGDYATTLPLCEKYLEKGVAQNFYYEVFLTKGISLLETGQENAALENFSAYEKFTIDDKVKGNWYKALTYLKMKDVENCKTELKKVMEVGRYKSGDAKELLGKM